MPRRKPTVAIVEDDKDLARLWRRKLINAGYEVVGIFASARAAWQALRKSPPAAILLDWELIPGPNGDWLLKQFAKRQLPTRILVVTSHDCGEIQSKAFDLGAHGFAGKPVPLPSLVLKLQEMLQGKVPLSSHNGAFLRQQLVRSPCAAWEKLSPQQQRIVALAAQGKRNKEIATVLVRSVRTIETQLVRIYDKLQLKARDIRLVVAMCAEALRTHSPAPLQPAA